MKIMARSSLSLGFVDLFAGCGGLALGFVAAGFEPLGAVEHDSDAAATYRRNVDGAIFAEDIAVINARRGWPKARIVVGGPPCQGFSQLGARDPHDPRNYLWREYVEAIDQTGAEFFVMENVPQLLKSEQFSEFIREVRKPQRGFNVVSQILNAADYGVPQIRRRAIIFGWKKGHPDLPVATHGAQSEPFAPHLSVRDALAGLSAIPDGANWHVTRPRITDRSKRRYEAVPKDGGNRFDMEANLDQAGLGDLVPGCWRRKRTGTTDVFGRLWWERPAPTIRTESYKPEKGRYLHPEEHRAITPREAARLQSFPDTFVFPEDHSLVSVARQIGNAVPPTLARALAQSVRTQLTGERSDVRTTRSRGLRLQLASV